MSFDVENGYAPRTFDDLLAAYTEAINSRFGTSYTPESIVGTDWYKYMYSNIQAIMSVENRIAEMSTKIQDYITYINDSIRLPKSSPDGIMQELQTKLGVISSIRPVDSEANAGHLLLACDVDTTAADYAELKQKIFDTMGECCTTGLYYPDTQTERGTFTAINGQDFPAAYALPVNKEFYVKITVTVSRNTKLFIPIEGVIVELFKTKFAEAYRFGYDFEPDAYLCKEDLPFASSIQVGYNFDGGSTWETEVYKAAYNEKIILKQVSAEIIDE